MFTNLERGRGNLNPIYKLSLEWAAEEQNSRLTDYREFQNYYDGAHNVVIPEKVQALGYKDIVDNFCEVIVDALAERLIITGFAADDAQLASRAWVLWKLNRLDEGSAMVHTQAVLKGDSFVLVDFDNAEMRPRVRFQSPESIKVEYEDSSNTVLSRASKRWTYIDSGPKGEPVVFTRLNVYYPDRIEKYIAEDEADSSGSFQQFRGLDENGVREPWPLPWVDKTNTPLGIPIFHFRNKSVGDAYGRSEIQNTIPQQDALNKAFADLMVILDTQGFPQRWISGAKAPAGGFAVGPGVTLVFDNPEAKAGVFPQAELDGVLSSINTILSHIATRSRTPAYMFTADAEYPSGEALKTAESGLVKKAESRSVGFGNTWEDVIKYALKLDNVFNKGNWDLTQMLEAQWGDFETRNELLHTQAVMLRQPVIGDRQALREMGYSEQQIVKILEERAEDDSRKQSLGGALLDSFVRNQSGVDLNPAQNVGAQQETNADEQDETQPPRFSGR